MSDMKEGVCATHVLALPPCNAEMDYGPTSPRPQTDLLQLDSEFRPLLIKQALRSVEECQPRVKKYLHT